MTEAASARLSHAPAQELLACPQCASALDNNRCAVCDQPYPLVGDLPWLFPQPTERLSLWRQRWQNELGQLKSEHAHLQHLQQEAKGIRRQRLTHRAKALSGQHTALSKLLAPLELKTLDQAASDTFADVDSWYRYDANPFRDWCWGEAENAAALSQILLALPTRPERILQLGSGAGRLAYDLHRSLAPTGTIALEHNPMLAWLGDRAAHGHAQTLWEFPTSPRVVAEGAVQQRLQRPAHHPELPAGLLTVVGDALAPPLQPERFDLVVTAWFSDICPAPISWLSQTIASLLEPGGIWVNHGSAAFDNAATAACGSLEEFIATAEAQPLQLNYSADVEMPYLASPHSRQRRQELVTTQAFQRSSKSVDVPGLVPWREQLPNWAEDATLPVPNSATVGAQRDASALRTFILSLVDGSRSRRDIAAQLEARGILTRADAEVALNEMLLTLHQ